MSYVYLFKYVLLGDAGVGTTSLLLRYTERRPQSSEADQPTVGIGFGARITTLACDSGETQVDIKLQIWDAPSGELFRSLVRPYYKETAAFILVYDITRRETFEGIPGWLTELKQFAGPNVICALVGNKCDLQQERQVSTEEGATYAAKLGMLFFETSTRDLLPGHHAAQTGVDTAFESTAAKVHAKVQTGVLNPADPEHGVRVGEISPRRVLTPVKGPKPQAGTLARTESSSAAVALDAVPMAPAVADTEATTGNPRTKEVLDIDPAWLLSAAPPSLPNEFVGRPRRLSEAELQLEFKLQLTKTQPLDRCRSSRSQVNIPSTVNERGVVRYVLKCSTADGRRWAILKRFSEFVSLRSLLSKQSDSIARLPFPPKSKFRGSKEQVVQDRMARLSTWMTQVCNEMMRLNAAEAQLEMAVNMFLAEDGSCAVDSLAAITMEIEGTTVRNLSTAAPELQAVRMSPGTPPRSPGVRHGGRRSEQAPRPFTSTTSGDRSAPAVHRRRSSSLYSQGSVDESVEVEFSNLVQGQTSNVVQSQTTTEAEAFMRGELSGSGRGTVEVRPRISWWDKDGGWCSKPFGAAVCDWLLFSRDSGQDSRRGPPRDAVAVDRSLLI